MYKIEQIKGNLKKYDVYNKTLSWNKENKEDDIKWIIGDMLAAYNDDELEAMGIICNYYFLEDNSVILSIETNPNCEDKLVVAELLKSMLEFSKEKLNAKYAYIKLLKTKEDSIEQVENSDFDFVKFDEDTITFEKKLINKEV